MWEYLVEDAAAGYHTDSRWLEGSLNSHGNDGWELVTVWQWGNGVRLIFKRQKEV